MNSSENIDYEKVEEVLAEAECETSDAERDNKVLEFVCGASYHAYCQTLGLIATGALKATQDA